MWRVGAAKRQLTGDFTGIELLGWGQPEGRIERVETPLQFRAVALQWEDERWVYVCAELCFITQSVRDGVFEELAARGLELAERELVIAATHTHSGPAGYAHDVFYNLTNAGHHPEVYALVVRTMADVAQRALESLEPGRVWVNRGQIPEHEPVAFNRSMKAYHRNPEVRPVDLPEQATNRDLTVLRVDSEHRPVAAICWFAVHNTNVHFDNRAIHGDNKGVAAALLEESQHDPDFVGIFAQGAPGDVTPNYRSSKRGFTIGHHDDDFESARFHGEIQARYAMALFQARGTEMSGLQTAARYVDFDGFEVDPTFTRGVEGRRTGKARYGLGLIEGTAEGPGPLWNSQIVRRTLVRTVALLKRGRRRVPGFRRRYADGLHDVYGPQFPFLEAGKGANGKAFGFLPMHASGVPSQIDPVVAEVQRLIRAGADLDAAWTPSVFPVHLTRIGSFALVSVPCEPTTVAGRRMADTVRLALGVEQVQVAGYSNAYHGYVTTNEEFQVQRYEGAHTIFGQWTLGAYRTALAQLAEWMGADERTGVHAEPVRYSEAELARRRYQGPPPTRNWG